MTSHVSAFKIWNRGFKECMVLVPGWATDSRIFSNLDLHGNYILPTSVGPFHFKEELRAFLDAQAIGQVSLFGWSSGGFLAAEFAADYPSRVHELILVSIRRSYPAPSLEKIKRNLEKNRRATLYKFYLECFSGGCPEAVAWFRDYLLEDYLEENDPQRLSEGLEYLALAGIRPASLAAVKRVRIFHGQKDRIAPFREAVLIKEETPGADFVALPAAGHVPFLSPDFKRKFYG